MNGRKRVAWNIRRLRVGRGLSQEALATDAEVDRSYMGRLERAEENPTVGILERIAKVLEADLLELFRPPRSGEPSPKPLRSGRKRSSVRKVSSRKG
jgi:transcriptional regulator with XRE-family HTH domain